LESQRRSGGCGIADMIFILQRRAGLIKLLEDYQSPIAFQKTLEHD
jgi:hypothetical protein